MRQITAACDDLPAFPFQGGHTQRGDIYPPALNCDHGGVRPLLDPRQIHPLCGEECWSAAAVAVALEAG
jgi:hypothetical protein